MLCALLRFGSGIAKGTGQLSLIGNLTYIKFVIIEYTLNIWQTYLSRTTFSAWRRVNVGEPVDPRPPYTDRSKRRRRRFCPVHGRIDGVDVATRGKRRFVKRLSPVYFAARNLNVALDDDYINNDDVQCFRPEIRSVFIIFSPTRVDI